MQLSLLEDKYQVWRSDLLGEIKEGSDLTNGLKLLVRRLNHAAFSIPLSRHFLNKIRRRIDPEQRRSRQKIDLSLEEMDDLHLWIDFLQASRDGISLNLLTI